MVNSGLVPPTTVTTDGALRMINAVEAVLSNSIRIACWLDRPSNIQAKLPDDEATEVMTHCRRRTSRRRATVGW